MPARSWYPSVGIANRLQDGQQRNRVRSQARVKYVFLLREVQVSPGPCTRDTGAKRQSPEATHSSPSSAEIRTTGAIWPLPHTAPWCGPQDNCNLYQHGSNTKLILFVRFCAQDENERKHSRQILPTTSHFSPNV
jgi:hypothetical protein